ncbi:hypothetical protein Cflav_PD4564 [Pedosphaera parvula Ellin514]|uniref:Uncharacterized protein n=1 Tax=Pedosphaera parvula (strain Ellin514) TaxID=320771 RepID=B9XE10_PEDPL|nr:hypothetical protein Cflav_PD4564 [Pedosphaera parvula Ellin514]
MIQKERGVMNLSAEHISYPNQVNWKGAKFHFAREDIPFLNFLNFSTETHRATAQDFPRQNALGFSPNLIGTVLSWSLRASAPGSRRLLSTKMLHASGR